MKGQSSTGECVASASDEAWRLRRTPDLGFIFSLASRQFCRFDNLLLILQQASPLGIAVVGMVFVLLVSGIDISVGRSMFLVSTFIGFLSAGSNGVLGSG